MWANGCAHILVKYYLDNTRNFHQPNLIVQFTSIITIVALVIQNFEIRVCHNIKLGLGRLTKICSSYSLGTLILLR